MAKKRFVRSTDRDEIYSLGPAVASKFLNLNETVTLSINEFVTPNIFFACESSRDSTLDRQMNILYDALSSTMRFSTLPQIKTVCVGKYNVDNRWYRAMVIDRDDNKMTVDLIFIDYGNVQRFVPLTSIRKLESTLSTQFGSLIDGKTLQSTGYLFGFVGFKSTENSIPWENVIKNFDMKKCFDFQIISVPLLNYNVGSGLCSIPFYLIKNSVFNKYIASNFNNYLSSELQWTSCDMDASIQFLMKSFKGREQHFQNMNLIWPSHLRSHKHILNLNFPKIACAVTNIVDEKTDPKTHTEDVGDDEIECQTPIVSDSESSENEMKEKSISSQKSKNKKDDDNVLLVVEDDVIHEDGEVNDDKCEDNEESDLYCSVIKWRMSSLLVKSAFENLQWHLPLPEDPTFKAIITSFNENLEFHINICSEDITKTFENMEKLLQKHYLLCNDSMLKEYVSSNEEFINGTICLCSFRSTYLRCIVLETTSTGDVKCRLLDFGDEIVIPKSDVIPISNHFCHIPALAVNCVLSGFDGIYDGAAELRERFHSVVEEANYQVFISLCLQTKSTNFNRFDENLVIEQPIPVEVFVMQLNEEGLTNIVSVNSMLQQVVSNHRLEVIEESSESLDLSYVHLESNLVEKGEIDNGMTDIFINENLHHQTDMRFQDGKRPICEYYRTKGRCFKGSKCQDRHVLESDGSDVDLVEWNMMENINYFDDAFERDLIIGSFIGLRVSAIYTSGLFYGYLTHDINGFIEDGNEYFDNDSCSDDNDGLEFKSIRDMEIHLRDFLKFEPVIIDKHVDLPVNTMVAVCENDLVRRASIRRLVSPNRYQLFLVDYGVHLEASVANLSLLPRKYLSRFKQQCFLCKLHGVRVSSDDSHRFADWFFDRVNKKVLHCKVIDSDHEGTNYVELFDFKAAADSESLNDLARKFFY